MRHILNAIPERIRNAFTDETLTLKTKATDDTIEIRLDGVVGDEYTQSDAGSIRQLLNQHKGKTAILRVASGGGLAYDGINIHNALAEHDGPTIGIVESLAASAAAVAVLGAQKIEMHANGAFMIHESIGQVSGHAWEIRELLQWMDRLDTAIAETIADKRGIDLAIVTKHLKGTGDGTVFSAQEALDAGYIDSIIGKKSAPKPAARNEVETQRFQLAAFRKMLDRERLMADESLTAKPQWKTYLKNNSIELQRLAKRLEMTKSYSDKKHANRHISDAASVICRIFESKHWLPCEELRQRPGELKQDCNDGFREMLRECLNIGDYSDATHDSYVAVINKFADMAFQLAK